MLFFFGRGWKFLFSTWSQWLHPKTAGYTSKIIDYTLMKKVVYTPKTFPDFHSEKNETQKSEIRSIKASYCLKLRESRILGLLHFFGKLEGGSKKSCWAISKDRRKNFVSVIWTNISHMDSKLSSFQKFKKKLGIFFWFFLWIVSCIVTKEEENLFPPIVLDFFLG